MYNRTVYKIEIYEKDFNSSSTSKFFFFKYPKASATEFILQQYNINLGWMLHNLLVLRLFIWIQLNGNLF